MKAMIRSVMAALLTLCAAALPAAAQQGTAFSNEQLEQIVAPIALYPDSLLTQVMMASTYPLEVVEADRWLKQNKNLKGSALESALKDKDWDPSIKGLCTLPDVLAKMSENLDWTQDLGDAFLGQKAELMDAVQRMRGKAYDAGNLKTTEQQVVTQQPDKIIVIQQPAPEVIYVPSYSPTVVYGAWSYPTYYYPPMYAPPPPGYGLLTFGVGMAVGAAIWGDCDWNGGWGHGDVDIDINNYNNFNRNTNVNWQNNQISNRSGNRSSWQHDPAHRKGVNYRDQGVAQQYGARGGTNRVSRDQARGWSQGQAGSRAAAGTQQRAAGGAQQRDRAAAGTQQRDRAAAGAQQRDRAAAGTQQQRSGTAAGPQQRDRAAASSRSTGQRSSAYSGSRSPNMDRAASSRGSASRGARSYGGGGRSGGGGRRR